MSRELIIIFVYNTELVKHECNDPALATVYFCPSWIPEERKTTLCGQIIGMAHFLKTVFGSTKIISLQNGKFCIQKFGKYIMAVGTDRHIPDWILENNADFLTNLIRFFHKDFEFMSTFYKDSETFIEKLHQIFESYIKLLNIESSAYKAPDFNQYNYLSDYCSKSQNFLNSCLRMKHVLSGLVQWNNKLLATQINSVLTKCLLLTHSTKSKVSAESVMTDFRFPKDLQLFQIYLKEEDYIDMLEAAEPYKRLQFNDIEKTPSVSCRENSASESTEKIFSEWNGFEYFSAGTSIQNPNISYNLFNVELRKKTSSLMDLNETKITALVLTRGKRRKLKTLCDPTFPYINSKGNSISVHEYNRCLNVSSSVLKEQNKGEEVFDQIQTSCVENNCDENESGSNYYSFETNSPDISSFSLRNDSMENYNSFQTPPSSASTDKIKTQSFIEMLGTKRQMLNNNEITEVFKKLEETDKFVEACKNSSLSAEIENVMKIDEIRMATNKILKKPNYENAETENCKYKDCVLLILNIKNVVVYLILEEEAINCSDLISKLHGQCMLFAKELSNQLDNIVDENISSETNTSVKETGSYLFTNHKWEYVDEGDLKEKLDLDSITKVHQNLIENSEITDLILRTEKNVIYGHQNEKKVVYYQLASNNSSGAPSSNDCMANIFSKARRRLSRTSRSSSLNLM